MSDAACARLLLDVPPRNGHVRHAVRATSGLRAKDRDLLGGGWAEPSSALLRDLSNGRGTRGSCRVRRTRAVVFLPRRRTRRGTSGCRTTTRCDERRRRVRGTRRRLATELLAFSAGILASTPRGFVVTGIAWWVFGAFAGCVLPRHRRRRGLVKGWHLDAESCDAAEHGRGYEGDQQCVFDQVLTGVVAAQFADTSLEGSKHGSDRLPEQYGSHTGACQISCER